MRIISQPVSATQVRPVEAPQGIRNRVPREPAPGGDAKVSGGPGSISNKPAVSATGGAGRALSAGNAATVDVGVTAQQVFHAVDGGPAEASLTAANRAYTSTDALRFKDVPFTLRVA